LTFGNLDVFSFVANQDISYFLKGLNFTSFTQCVTWDADLLAVRTSDKWDVNLYHSIVSEFTAKL